MDRLINALEAQEFLIGVDLQLLLRAADCEDDEIAGLQTSSYHERLLDQRLAKPVVEYLGQAYGPYREALANCERILEDIAQSIGGLTARPPSQVSQT